MGLSGIYLPIITPMENGFIDYTSYKKLLEHYSQFDLAGFIPLGTTGEAPTVSWDEQEALMDITMSTVGDHSPVFWGFSGNNTAEMTKNILRLENKGLSGLLVATPYYNRPGQEGLYEHYHALTNSSDLPIILYNIPYRTGVNMSNDTIRRLAEHPGIIGLKDATGDMKQTTELLLDPPENFDILTGEDLHLLSHLALGGKGGILASAHINTALYINLYKAMENNDLATARSIWSKIGPTIPYFFKESNPAPIKYLLHKEGLIDSDELRLPLTRVSDSYSHILNSKFADISMCEKS